MAAVFCGLPGRPGPPPGLVETASQNRRRRRHQNTHDQGNEIKEMMQNISNEHCNYAKDLAQMTQRFDKISIWLPQQINEILERLALLERVFVFVGIWASRACRRLSTSRLRIHRTTNLTRSFRV
ncbi:unnamed protein product [Polarella glacialis]|uniref:Uncharacterized protein n=1 Tax=Polarella glacialis TaxID=89957 RepID=A0A813KZ74_POLGL|nr:unnamed protein product [Polarella glacialis]CAE8716896.1 unnamed protein product [Polarella glacialis]